MHKKADGQKSHAFWAKITLIPRRQPPFVQSAATPASKMEAAGLADLHGTTDARDNEWLDVVAPSEYFSWLTVASLVLCAELFRMLTWSYKRAEHLSEPSRLPCSQGWHHASTGFEAGSLWEVGETGTR